MREVEFRFAIDRGGTFTDVYAEVFDPVTAETEVVVKKLLSEDPDNYADAPTEGIRRVLDQFGITQDKKIPTGQIRSIRMGTTVATNALLERNGAKTALVINDGFGDLLAIANQNRDQIFDLQIPTPTPLYETVIQVQERVRILTPLNGQLDNSSSSGRTSERGVTGEEIEVLLRPDVDRIRQQLTHAYEHQHIRSLAIVLLHGYTYPHHENLIASIAQQIGFEQISTSHQVSSRVKMVPRGFTTCVDAYLTPVLHNYLRSFQQGFDEQLVSTTHLTFMQSDGGLVAMNKFSGHRAILSGPAGGVVGYATSSSSSAAKKQIIGFDMGGTSTDVSRYSGSEYEMTFETQIAGVSIQAPQLAIETVAAGGGSCLFYVNGLFVVGPESARADPGPVCYRKKGGKLSVTDANLVLGRILPQHFPCIFGECESLPLDRDASFAAFAELKRKHKITNYTVEEIALGFLKVANETMCRPIRNLTQMRGYDISEHLLACFGGAGPQHGCAIAKSLQMKEVLIHKYSGILSAYGLSVADVVLEKQQPVAFCYQTDFQTKIKPLLNQLTQQTKDQLISSNDSFSWVETHSYLNMRYDGTDNAVMTTTTFGDDYEAAFLDQYKREYGFLLENRQIIVDDVRVRAIGHSQSNTKVVEEDINEEIQSSYPEAKEYTEVWFEEVDSIASCVKVGVFFLSELSSGDVVKGPAIVMQDIATIVVEPNCTGRVTKEGNFLITLHYDGKNEMVKQKNRTGCDPIELSIFAHRFMGIAEQMGRTLQRTSISVNIKERLDFSCALFDSSGGLVANAPHLPVHLGAMQQAVKYQLKHWYNPKTKQVDLVDGDVLVSNHPQLAGGSHLPDITVITPVFSEDGTLVFFVASRGHHADIGGISPGSMPPLSKHLSEEGAAIIALKLIQNNTFQQEKISQALEGTRNLRDNLSDLKAQIAANRMGKTLMLTLCQQYSLQVVQNYMYYIQQNAEMATRQMLNRFSRQRELQPIDSVYAEDFLDDGTKIALTITIHRQEDSEEEDKTTSAVFDFAGTGHQVYGNLNAPPAVSYSAIIYSLRCLLNGSEGAADIPLNQGCLNPIKILIPESSVLNPSADAAVVGGNVLTSQRVTDVILKAFGACAASQGCMNNLTFGSDSLSGYYETIAGGAGAGPSWHGHSGVHTHMTNTRITDPEILEKRYPVLLRQFQLRTNSGGKGRFNGGEGVTRELEFLVDGLTVSILSERRSFQPYGLEGGQPGERGLNILKRKDGRIISLGGKNTVTVDIGDRLVIQTPGGGGYGK